MRRAECARLDARLTKSATTSPVMSVGFGLSHERGARPADDAEKARRRFSGPAFSTGPYTQACNYPYDESPSPISSDSESPPLYMKSLLPQRTSLTSPHIFPSVPTRSDFTFTQTPSTSPFLGPLRTLNIHSTNPSRAPSRAPSPVLLPPPHLTLDSACPRSTGSPTYSAPAPWSKHPHSHRFTSAASSPGLGFARGLGSNSTSSSRAPSPPLWPGSRPAVEHPYPHSHHHHLAHSVRAAFGMTPIMASAPSAPMAVSHPHPHSHSHSAYTTPARVLPYPLPPLSLSIPGSRAGSPPITLAPLKVRDASDVEGEPREARAEDKVELPGFSAFEAASLARF